MPDTPSTPATVSSVGSSKSISEFSPAEYETALRKAHAEAKKLARSDDASPEVFIAKLAVAAMRQVHANDFLPKTAIRAMTIQQYADEKRGTRGTLLQAKREMRDEARAARTATVSESDEIVREKH